MEESKNETEEDVATGNIAAAENETTLEQLEPLLESIVRITLAGLGGSFVGLSQEKRLEAIRVVTGAASAAAARRRRSLSTQISNLPLTWAISCMAFCVIIETSRLTSPTSRILNQWRITGRNDNETEVGDENDDDSMVRALTTMGDFTLGGAVAGIAGSFGRNTHLRQRLPSAMFKGPRRFFGLVPGLALGLAAGILQASADYGQASLESLQSSSSSAAQEMAASQIQETEQGNKTV
jgi:hypothetical protein